jgi:hypothetical protein
VASEVRQNGRRELCCPACRSSAIQAVYSLRDIPAQSAILLGSPTEAGNFPCGDLALVWCEGCGLAFNRLFDKNKVEYGVGYEESQGASPTFRQFAGALARRWGDRYELTGKRAIEIGCGKGEFLRLFCEITEGTGIGFDPAWDPARSPSDDRVTFVRSVFDARHVPAEADIIICRHTLEHIGDAHQFVQLLRAACGERLQTVVAVEVPDIKRILDEGAFWDVYYEHACYFSAGSLARLFAQNGFDVLNVSRVYGDQYLVLEARPGSGGSSALPAGTDDLDDLRTGVTRFRAACARSIAAWRERFEAWEQSGESVVVWGSGSKAVGFLTAIGNVGCVRCVVDINPARHGFFMPGCTMPIIAPQQLTGVVPDRVIVMNPIYRAEVERALAELGLESVVMTAIDLNNETGCR